MDNCLKLGFLEPLDKVLKKATVKIMTDRDRKLIISNKLINKTKVELPNRPKLLNTPQDSLSPVNDEKT